VRVEKNANATCGAGPIFPGRPNIRDGLAIVAFLRTSVRPPTIAMGLIMTVKKKTSGKGSKRRTKHKSQARKVPVPKIFADLPAEPLTALQQDGLKEMVSLANARELAVADRIAAICPPGSILDVIANIFRETTDIPLELPVCMTMSFISALLLHGGGLWVSGKYVDPFLWMILLSESGNGKTYTEKFVSAHIRCRLFPPSGTAAKFVADLAENNRSLWLQDEFAQLLKRIQANPHMADMREYMLRTYDKSEIVRSNLKSTTHVPDPVLSILGMTVGSTFADSISSEMMLDGFMQRFQIVYADNDPKRPMKDFPYYRAHEKQWANKFAKAWQKIARLNLQGDFNLGSGAIEEYKDQFQEMVARLGDLPGSFVRRTLWNANKLALVYHVILGKGGKIVDREDMRWAMNMTAIHLHDTRRLIDSFGASELAKLIDRGASICQRFQARYGRAPTRREFCMRLQGVDNQNLMNFIWQIINEK
jgi:hypothetical protein